MSTRTLRREGVELRRQKCLIRQRTKGESRIKWRHLAAEHVKRRICFVIKGEIVLQVAQEPTAQTERDPCIARQAW
jgi:hypothetical protein